MFRLFRKKKARPPEAPYPQEVPYDSPPGGRRRQPIPDTIERYYVPLPVLEATHKEMRRFGKEQRECYVWWGGYFTHSGEAQVVTAILPDARTDFGRVHLTREQLAKLDAELRRRDQVLLVELHTHPPGGGGQNDVDAAHAAAPYPGFITVVVPDFASPHFHDLRGTHVYEYLAENRWREVGADEIQQRFVIESAFQNIPL